MIHLSTAQVSCNQLFTAVSLVEELSGEYNFCLTGLEVSQHSMTSVNYISVSKDRIRD